MLPIIAELSLYILLIISIISGVTFNVLSAATNTDGLFDLFFTGLISLFAGIGFIVIILEVTKRWRYIGGAIFLGLAISMLFWIPSSYNGESDIFNNYPYLIAPAIVCALSWAISGVIIIIYGRFLSELATAPTPDA